MIFKIKKNVISELRFSPEQDNLIIPWGIETSDYSSFFSLEEGVGYRLEQEKCKQVISDSKYQYEFKVKMKTGEFLLQGEETILDSKTIKRTVTLTALTDVLLIDFVMRFRFPSNLAPIAQIGPVIVKHEDKNIYHTYQEKNVELFYPSYTAIIQIKNCTHPSTLSPFMYVRDQKGEWVVHCRMLPVVPVHYCIKLCTKFFGTRSIPIWLSDFLCSFQGIKKALVYRNEKKPYQWKISKFFNLNAFPLIRLKNGESISWDCSCQLLRKM